MLDVIHDDIGETAVRDKVVKPAGRPARGPLLRLPGGSSDRCRRLHRISHEDGQLADWLGAEVVDYPVKAQCCGGHMTQISEPQAFELIRRLLQSATDNRPT